MHALCNLNGEITAEAEARIPVLDRGFLFGDSIYEVLRTRHRVPFAWPEHFERLRRSADGIALDLDLTDEQILARIKETQLAAGGDGEAYVRVIVTRGPGSAPNIDLAYAGERPTWVILVRPLPAGGGGPVRLALIERLRNDRRALDPAIKSGNYLNNVLGLAEAKARGATDCLFLNQAGMVTEASTANFCIVDGDAVVTPPLAAGLLAGTTRRLLAELCREQEIAFVERDLSRQHLTAADEMFLTSTMRDIAPVVELDAIAVGDGRAGPLTQRLQRAFDEFCERRLRERYAPAYERL